MIFQNLRLIGYSEPQHIEAAGNVITTITSDEGSVKHGTDEKRLKFETAFAFPGLINSHDHLDFNLFPRLGNGLYTNYMDWGPDIHSRQKDIISAVEKIPQKLRVQWGIYKNLLNGVTTVVNHGRYLDIKESLITILQDYNYLHAIGTERWWRYEINRPFANNKPFVIHIGEGTDTAAKKEIDELIKWNIFKRKLIGVHGVAMSKEQAKAFEAIVWCPDSNLFLLGATAAVNELKKQTKILFGTDSTLSASWNMWEQIRLARKTSLLSDGEIVDSLTSTPASVWNLPNNGVLAEGKNADIVIAKMKGDSAIDSFFLTDPEDILLIVRRGHVLLFDEALLTQLNFRGEEFQAFSKIVMNTSGKYIKGNLPALITEIKHYTTEPLTSLYESALNIP